MSIQSVPKSSPWVIRKTYTVQVQAGRFRKWTTPVSEGPLRPLPPRLSLPDWWRRWPGWLRGAVHVLPFPEASPLQVLTDSQPATPHVEHAHCLPFPKAVPRLASQSSLLGAPVTVLVPTLTCPSHWKWLSFPSHSSPPTTGLGFPKPSPKVPVVFMGPHPSVSGSSGPSTQSHSLQPSKHCGLFTNPLTDV